MRLYCHSLEGGNPANNRTPACSRQADDAEVTDLHGLKVPLVKGEKGGF